MPTFADLVASRKDWIQRELIPWCRQASLADLGRAEEEWLDIAGKVAPQFSLWLWAWSRFPVLYVEGLRGLEETHEVVVRLRSGETATGYPDARASQRGKLTLVRGAGILGPFSLDDIEEVQRV